MYFKVIPRKRKKKKKKVAPSDAIEKTDFLGRILSGENVRRDTIGTFGSSVLRTDAGDSVAKTRIDWDVIFRTPETEITRIRAERLQQIEQNHLRKDI